MNTTIFETTIFTLMFHNSAVTFLSCFKTLIIVLSHSPQHTNLNDNAYAWIAEPRGNGLRNVYCIPIGVQVCLCKR